LFDPTGESVEVSAFVAPAFRRQGVFRALLAEARQKWAGIDRPWLLVVDREEADGVAVARHRGSLEFTETTLALNQTRRPAFRGLPEGLTLMKADASDADQAARVLSGGDQEALPGVRDFVLGVIADPDRSLYLLKEGERTVATLGLNRHEDLRWLFALAVDPSRHRRGWGRALVLAVMELSSYGAREYQLEVNSENDRAAALYRSLGFVDQRVTDYYRL
jgi:ribosomal protein S18 acetylase RimI-like enzyme